MDKLIDHLELPHGLRGLSTKELEQVCKELRDELIDTVSLIGAILHQAWEQPKSR